MSEHTWPASPADPGLTGHSPALQQLFADAMTPAHEDELAGLADVLTAFAGREAVDGPAASPRWNRRKGLLPSLLAIKVLIAAAGAAAAGGFAVAAATDSLPRPLQSFAHDVLGAPAPPEGGSRGPQRPSPAGSFDGVTSPGASANSTRPGVGATGAPGKASRIPGEHASPAPAAPGKEPSRVGRSKGSGNGNGNGNSGGNGHSGGPPASHPTPSAPSHPNGPPSTHPGGGAPSSHPGGGQPSTHPTGPPARLSTPPHPTGPPSTHPGGGPPSTHPGGGPPSTHP